MKTLKQHTLADKVQSDVWVGVDTHRDTNQVGLFSHEQGLIHHWRQPSSPGVLCKVLAPIKERVRMIVYEAGPTGFGLARTLRGNGFPVMVVAPSHIPKMPGRQPKTDSLDCQKLAMLAAKGMLQQVYTPTEEEEADRALMRQREQYVRKLRRVKHHIKSFLLFHGLPEPEGLTNWANRAIATLKAMHLNHELRFCLDQLLKELGWMQGQVLRVTKHIKELAATERHQQAYKQLTSVPGVGLITAMTFRTELLAPERFTRPEQVTRMIGLAPQIRQSGNSQWNGAVMKSGNARIRSILVESSWRWIRYDPWARSQYMRILSNTGSAKKAIVALARKLAIKLWRIETRGESYKMAA